MSFEDNVLQFGLNGTCVPVDQPRAPLRLYRSAANIPILIASDTEIVRGMTDADGHYDLRLPSAGKVTWSAFFRPSTKDESGADINYSASTVLQLACGANTANLALVSVDIDSYGETWYRKVCPGRL